MMTMTSNRFRLLLGLLLTASLTLGAGCDEKKPAAKPQTPAVKKEAKTPEQPKAPTKPAAAKKAEPKKEVTTATIGQPAPAFTLKDEDGKEHKLEQYKGKVVVLEWTNPQCPFVVRHYKEKTMVDALSRLDKEKVVWLAIDSSHYLKPGESAAWKKKHGFTYVTLQDVDGKTGKLYGASTTPHMFVVGADGTLQYSGAIDDDPSGEKKPAERTNHVVNAVQSLVKGEKVATPKTKPYGCSVKYNKA